MPFAQLLVQKLIRQMPVVVLLLFPVGIFYQWLPLPLQQLSFGAGAGLVFLPILSLSFLFILVFFFIPVLGLAALTRKSGAELRRLDQISRFMFGIWQIHFVALLLVPFLPEATLISLMNARGNVILTWQFRLLAKVSLGLGPASLVLQVFAFLNHLQFLFELDSRNKTKELWASIWIFFATFPVLALTVLIFLIVYYPLNSSREISDLELSGAFVTFFGAAYFFTAPVVRKWVAARAPRGFSDK